MSITFESMALGRFFSAIVLACIASCIEVEDLCKSTDAQSAACSDDASLMQKEIEWTTEEDEDESDEDEDEEEEDDKKKLIKGPSRFYCSNVNWVLKDSASKGEDDCESRCVSTSKCNFFSIWESGGANWCRLTRTCSQMGEQWGQKIRIYQIPRTAKTSVSQTECKVPSTEGYDFTGIGGNIKFAEFAPKGVTCALGYNGEVKYKKCTKIGEAFSVSGCQATSTGLYRGPGNDHCADSEGIVMESVSSGEAECALRCAAQWKCHYFSIWDKHASYWCRLTERCNKFAQQPQHEINIYHKHEAAVYELFKKPGPNYCANGKISMSKASSKDECKILCAANLDCQYFSFWVVKGVNWCRLTKACDALTKTSGATVSIYRKPEGTCSVPSTEGYDFSKAGGILTMKNFKPTGVTCANGYKGSVKYTKCPDSWRDYSVSGCQAFCKVPSTEGYDFSKAGGSLELEDFAPTGVTCATGYTGKVVYRKCKQTAEDYKVYGCEKACIAPSTTGYDFSNAEVDMSFSNFKALGVTCATGYLGEVKSERCEKGGEAYALSGCQAELYKKSGPDHCKHIISETTSSGKDECKWRCAANENCHYYSLWESGIGNWCRLSDTCDLGKQWGHKISVYRSVGVEEAENFARCTFPVFKYLPEYDFKKVADISTVSWQNFALQGISCAKGFAGTVEVTRCKTPWTPFSVSGCEAVCNVPSSMKGYDFSKAGGVLTRNSKFAPTGITCAAGYSGTVKYTTCVKPGTPYSVSGCLDNAKVALFKGPGIHFCADTISESRSKGKVDCEKKCAAEAKCKFFSIWYGGLNWCRLSRNCDKQKTQWTSISIYRMPLSKA